MPKAKLFLIDAHALCYRSFYAIRGLTTSVGQPTNAVYGFVSTLKKILRDYEPAYMAVCFDVGKKTIRQERYAEYKIHRPSMPDELVSQIPLIKRAVQAYGIPIFEMEGFEADDVIATLATRFGKDDTQVVIVSGDKDMVQLLNGNVSILNSRQEHLIDPQEALNRYGFSPQKIVDYISLAGDKTDNIPGVTGIGEVTAKKLIDQFGSLDGVYAHIDQITSEKLRQKLLEQREQAFFSRELAILDRNVPVDCSLDALALTAPDKEKLIELFRDLEFHKFVDELAGSQEQSFALEAKPLKTDKDFNAFIQEAKKTGVIAFSLGFHGQEEGLFKDNWVYTGRGAVRSVAHQKLSLLQPLLAERSVTKICHDVKELLKVFDREGLTVDGPVFDVMLAAYLVAPAQTRFDMESLCRHFLNQSLMSRQDGSSAIGLWRLYETLRSQLDEKALLKLFEEIEIPLAYVLAAMEKEGVKLDCDLLKKLSKDCQKKIDTLISQLYEMADMEFNINSPKQLSQVLFEKLKLPVIKKTKTGYSTDEAVLTKLARKHKLPAKILEYRQLAKLKSTYIDALPKLVNAKSGRVHATFVQTGTETGRLSSKNPNLQNIPIRTPLGRQIRKAFVPAGRDHCLVAADYSQIELRVLAHMSGDKALRKAFEKGEDVHAYTASLIFDVSEKKVTAQMRNSAKRVNFGIIYGMSAFGLAKDLNISQNEAQTFIDRYFLRYPKVKDFMDQQVKNAEQHGYVLTLLNRRRYLPEIKSSNMAVRQFAQRQAINTPVQGSAADLIKLAMINIDEEIRRRTLNSKMIITVHDELVFDVPIIEQKEMVDLIRHYMENPLKLSVPIKVVVKTGPNWLEVQEV